LQQHQPHYLLDRPDPCLPGVDRTWRSKPPLPPIDHSQKFSNSGGPSDVRKISNTQQNPHLVNTKHLTR
jgi:hypothetical protein